MNQIKHIRLDKLRPPEFDSRLISTPEEDDELRDSIRELGILEPLIVKETSEGFEIVAGHRRFREAGRAGLAAVPCVVIKTTGAEADKIKLHENIKRLPLSHVDQAYTFAHLMKEYGLTEQQVADLIGKSIAFVSQHLSLLSCDKNILAAVHDGRINFSVARELIQCKDADERDHLREIVENSGATQTVVRGWVQESNRETESLITPDRQQYPIQREAESTIPMYPCAACEQPTALDKIKVIRLCSDCHYIIFSSIEREKYKARAGIPKEPD